MSESQQVSSASAPLLLDTHIWLRFLGVSGDLRQEIIPIIEAALIQDLVFVSTMSVWECAMLHRDGKLQLQPSVKSWVYSALRQPGFQLLPYTPEIAIESVELPTPVHKDPADRVLIASARIHQLSLVTRDEKILSYAQQGLLSCLQG